MAATLVAGPLQRPDRVAGERLVDDHANDAHHRRAAVVALGVQLERLHFLRACVGWMSISACGAYLDVRGAHLNVRVAGVREWEVIRRSV